MADLARGPSENHTDPFCSLITGEGKDTASSTGYIRTEVLEYSET